MTSKSNLKNLIIIKKAKQQTMNFKELRFLSLSICRLMRKVADPHIYLIIREGVEDNNIIIGSQRPPAK